MLSREAAVKIRKILYLCTLAVLLAVFGCCVYYVGSYFLEGRQQQEEYAELSAMVENVRSDPTYPSSAAAPEDTGAMLPEYAPLYARNSHLVGWLKIDGTQIDYPVMQTPDAADYYLDRDFDREESARGCLYARETCDIFLPSDNITVYGHNMLDGSMFAGLLDYRAEDFWAAHRYLTFDTLYGHYTYQVFAVFTTTASIGEGFAYYEFENAGSEAEFDAFIETCLELSFYDTGILPVYGDKLLCLSTCEYTQVNGRFVVVAVRMDEKT